jgi:hypothetical protein
MPDLVRDRAKPTTVQKSIDKAQAATTNPDQFIQVLDTMQDLEFIRAATSMGYTADEIQEYISNRDAALNKHSSVGAQGETLVPGSYKAPENKNMADGGLVQAGQAPTDPAMAGGPQADDLNRNLSQGEFVMPTEVVNVLGQETLDQLVGMVQIFNQQGKDPAVLGQAIQGALADVVRTEQQNTMQGGQPAPMGNVPPATGVMPSATQGTTGNVQMPSGTGPMRTSGQ